MPADTTESFGDGRYRVIELLGKGASGAVYKAFDNVVGRYVAIKTIATEDIPAEEVNDFVQMFQAEAQAAGRLDHPGIVTVYDYNPSAEEPYIVMSLVEGGTLSSVFARRGKLPYTEVIELGIQVAEALEFAHQHGIQAHRDIKPGNIFLTVEGRYKVGDFGIAHTRLAGDQTTRSTFISGGTPRYMAPEQVATPRKVDGRSDLFSLCVVLYEALTGTLPYQGVTLNFDPEEQPDVAKRIVSAAFARTAPLKKVMPTLPAVLSQAIDCGMHPDPAQRFHSCGEFAAALRRAEESLKNATVLHRPARSPTTPVATPEPLRARSADGAAPAKKKIDPILFVVAAVLVLAAWRFWPAQNPSNLQAIAQSGGKSTIVDRLKAQKPQGGQAGGSDTEKIAGAVEGTESGEEPTTAADEEALESLDPDGEADTVIEEVADDKSAGSMTTKGVTGDFAAVNSDGRSGVFYIPRHVQKPLPLLVLFHGTGGSGKEMMRLFKELADEHEFAIAAPDSHLTSDGRSVWQVGKSPKDITEDVDHVRACIRELQEMDGFELDPARQMAAGYSSGGAFSPYLASLSSTYEAFAVLHGTLSKGSFGSNYPRGWFSTGDEDRVRTSEQVKADMERLEAEGFDRLEFQEFTTGPRLSEEEMAALIRWWLEE